MQVPYYSPNFYLKDLFLVFFKRNSKEEIENYFRKYSGKQYILITASCRSALYLTYKSLQRTGTVITSPLTCRSAIDPIIWAGNYIVFSDININTLNISEADIIDKIKIKPVAIQIINHGGVVFDTKRLKESSSSFKDTIIVEDCAQSFGAELEGYPGGHFADVACFSFIKNLYGIGGGILATNNKSLYLKAKNIQEEFPAFSTKIIFYRGIRNLLESYRRFSICNRIFRKLIKYRNSGKNSEIEDEGRYLKQPHWLFTRVVVQQLKKRRNLHEKRIVIGLYLAEKLRQNGLMYNYQGYNLSKSSFTKLFVYNPCFDSGILIDKLNKKGIEAKHLEHRTDAAVQPILDNIYPTDKISGLRDCQNYNIVNQKIVSLPIHEKMKQEILDHIINELKDLV